jgi:hypothetical protein
METIKEYLEANDGQSLIGSLLQYGFDRHAIEADEKAGIIEIEDSMVHLVKKPKTIDLTPTWQQWLNLIMVVALRSQDPNKVLEPVSEDFKKMAMAADAWNAIPEDIDDLIQEAIDLIINLTEGQEDEDGRPVYPALVDKLKELRKGVLKAFEIIKR